MSVHGTNAAYHDHYRRGERPCDACKIAHARGDAERRYRNSPLHGTPEGLILHTHYATPVCDLCLDAACYAERVAVRDAQAAEGAA